MKEVLTSLDNQKSNLAPFVAGAVVGAVLGLLFAPKPGKEMRKKLKMLASGTKENISTTMDRGRALYGEARAIVSSAVDAGKQTYAQEREKL